MKRHPPRKSPRHNCEWNIPLPPDEVAAALAGSVAVAAMVLPNVPPLLVWVVVRGVPRNVLLVLAVVPLVLDNDPP